MFLLRPAIPSDLPPILELARYLDSPNLPCDEAFLAARLERSARSFARPGPPDDQRQYQFALVDAQGSVVGTAVILSKHGTRSSPHVYLEVGEEERYSPSVDVAMRHLVLRLGATWDGPTELGSLVLHPDCRGHPEQPGKLLSWGRFAYIARHPSAFERNLLAEMRANLDERGRSAFWDAFGGRFTGMSYAEADRRSASDKTFILDLFPRSDFYASLLDKEVADQLGVVHPETAPALRLLELAGFQPIGEIDPFDAGPYIGAPAPDVVPIRDSIGAVLADEEPESDAPVSIISSEDGGRFRAVAAPAQLEGDAIRVTKEARRRLGLSQGDTVMRTPLPPRSRRRASGG